MLAAATVLSAAVLCPVIEAQNYNNTAVTVSQTKIRRDGKLYYAHTVLEKQTLYSISKAYEVTTDDIYAANPSLKETGLKTNTIIFIPIAQEATSQTTASGNAATTGGDASAKADEAGQEGAQEAKSSDAVSKDSNSDTKKNKKDYFIHTVKWSENLDIISEKYGVPVSVIMEVNGLTNRKLTKKQQLKIPTRPELWETSSDSGSSDGGAADGDSESGSGADNQTSVSGNEDLADASDGSLGQDDDQSEGWEDATPKDRVNALLMLPFNSGSSSPSQLSMDFYSGALLAARQLGSEGLNVDLSVYDVYKDNINVPEETLESSDFVIGPLSTKGLTTLLEEAPASTHIISPLDYRTSSLTENNSNFIQSASSQTSQYEDLGLWIQEELQPGDSVIMIYEKGTAGLAMKEEVEAVLNKYDYSWSAFSYSILEGRAILSSLEKQMSAEGMNRFIIASENEAFVGDAIRNLNLLIHQKYNVTLYGGSKIRSYETIEVENLHNTRLHTSVSFQIDYNDPRVMKFLMEYRALYNAEPSQTAFQGYDTMYYFTSMCSKYGSRWTKYLTEVDVPMLMSDFKFEKSGDGLTRTAVRRVIYDEDYSVVNVKANSAN